MAYFHSRMVRNRGGRRRRVMRRLCGETVEEMQSVARRWPEAVSINWPPRGRDAYRSRSIPTLFVDITREDEILSELGSVDVPEEYITLLTMMIRERFYNEKCGGPTEASSKFFEQEIRGKTILLLRAGAWVDDPESLSLQNLNKRIEKCDLGRRSDLNFSSNPIPINKIQKYDQDARHERAHPEEPDEEMWLTLYRNADDEERQQLFADETPWRQNMLRDLFGEP